jgi:hypothetical protein
MIAGYVNTDGIVTNRKERDEKGKRKESPQTKTGLSDTEHATPTTCNY